MPASRTPLASASNTDRPAKTPTVLPFELAMNHVLLRGRVNGTEGWLILDTGSSMSALDTNWAADVGARQTSTQARVVGAGDLTTMLATVDALALPGIELQELTMVLVPLDGVSGVHGRPIGGTLGYDFLSRYVVEIDYAARELRLHDPDGYQYLGTGVAVPISIHHGFPTVDATVVPATGDPVAARLLLDLGTSTLAAILTTPFVETHGLRAGPGVDAPLGAGVGGMAFGRVVRLRELRLGDLVVRQPTAGLGRDHAGFLGSTFVDGTVGAPVFERTTMILDYRRSRVIFEPGARFAEPYEYDASGLHVAAPAPGEGGGPVVTFVVPSGPGDEAGVRPGDEVVAVDGREAKGMPLDALWRALRATGTARELTIHRDGGVRTLRLEPRPLV